MRCGIIGKEGGVGRTDQGNLKGDIDDASPSDLLTLVTNRYLSIDCMAGGRGGKYNAGKRNGKRAIETRQPGGTLVGRCDVVGI